MKRKILIMGILSILLFCNTFLFKVSAEVLSEEAQNIKDTYEELVGYVESVYYFGFPETDVVYEIIDLNISKDNIIFELNGCVDFVDVIGTLNDGRYVNISNQVEYFIEDPNIVKYDRGCIYAKNQGSTKIIISYGGFSREINVLVNGYKEMLTDLDSLIAYVDSKSDMDYYGVPKTEWVSVMKRAYDIMNVRWTPSKPFIPNEQNITFPAGVELKGVPYSQTGKQCNDIEFLNSLNNTDFYDAYYRPNSTNRDPMYGVDCSGFVSYAYAIPRHSTIGIFSDLKKTSPSKFEKIGIYSLKSNDTVTTNLDKSQLKSSYRYLYQSCALLQRTEKGGHTRLVVTTYDNYVECIETFNNFPEQIRYSLDQLANSGYIPYTVKDSYYNTKPY